MEGVIIEVVVIVFPALLEHTTSGGLLHHVPSVLLDGQQQKLDMNGIGNAD